MDWAALVKLGVSLAQQGVTYASATAAQKQALDALAQAQKNVDQTRQDFTDVGTPGYASINPASTQLGDTELKGIQNDPQGRMARQQAMAQLQQLADSGGLSLGDMQALNEVQQNLNRNQSARQANVTNQFAARGQLNGGAALTAQLAGGQAANQSANAQGESAAAQAQARANQALMQKATLGRQMSQDDYEKKAAAAKAADLIKQRNMDNSIGAQKYNNTELQQGFDDRYRVAAGKSGLLPQANQIALATGKQNSDFTAAKGAFAADALGTAGNAFGKGSTGSTVAADDPSQNPNGPGGGAPAYQDPGSNTYPGSNPNEWAKYTQPEDEGVKLKDDNEP